MGEVRIARKSPFSLGAAHWAVIAPTADMKTLIPSPWNSRLMRKAENPKVKSTGLSIVDPDEIMLDAIRTAWIPNLWVIQAPGKTAAIPANAGAAYMTLIFSGFQKCIALILLCAALEPLWV